MVGIAGVADIRAVEDLEVRTRLEKINIDLSYLLLMRYENYRKYRPFLFLSSKNFTHPKSVKCRRRTND